MDTFYNIDTFPLKKNIEILNDAKEKCYRWWADILDCSKSWARQKINCTFEEIMDRVTDKTRFTFINRKYIDDYIEVGFSLMTTPDYFLWIQIDKKELPYFIKKYNLKEKE